MKKNSFVLGVFLSALMVTLASCGEGRAVKTIKSATLADFPVATIGEAFDGVYSQSEWSASRDNGKANVWCRGTVLYADEPTSLHIGFLLDEETGEFEISDMLLDDITLTPAMQIKILCDIYGEDAVETLVTRIENDVKQATEIIKKIKKAKTDEKDSLLSEFETVGADMQDTAKILDKLDMNSSQRSRLQVAMWDLALLQL